VRVLPSLPFEKRFIGLSQMLVDRLESDSKDRHMATIIERSANRLMQTLDSVLTLARIEAGDAALEIEQFDLVEEIRHVLTTMRPHAEAKDLELTLDAPGEGVEVTSNSEALSRIVFNLVANAIKFTEEGSVSVRIEDDEPRFRICVQDSGVGIDEEFVDHAHERFRRQRTGDSREYSGIGLRLTIVSRIVELLHGRLEIESAKDQGTTVTVEFPRSPVVAAHRDETLAAPVERAPLENREPKS
jgi:signal transduction histidine kinase